MTAMPRSWNAVVASDVEKDNREEFKRETEVQARLIVKPSRDYIYDLLTKMRFPLIKIEAIIERRGNLVDFTCKDRNSAETLQRMLEKHPNVKEARLFESEYTDVKLTGVPHRLPDGKIINLLNKRHGEVLYTKRLKDRKGYFDGRRIYRMRSAQIQERPIPQLIRVCGCSIQTDYYGQPTRCFLCKKFGHMKNDCPEAVKTPPASFFDMDLNLAAIPNSNNEQETEESATNASTPIPPEPRHPQGADDKTLRCVDDAPRTNAQTDRHKNERNNARQLGKDPNDDVSEFSTSSSEADEVPDDSLFATDEETAETGHKRRHSPDEQTEKKQKPNKFGENYNCECGCEVILPDAAGCFSLCDCGMYYTRCTCDNVISTIGDKPANCERCRKPIPRLNLDKTV